ncbi:MAG: hypothetical protein Q9191_004326 [Dirinaria sp. TL-2023a]
MSSGYREHFESLKPQLPVVNVGTNANPSYLPAEVCFIEPGQSSQAKLDPDQTSSMIGFAVRPPGYNAKSIEQDGYNTVGLSSDMNPDLLESSASTARSEGRGSATQVHLWKISYQLDRGHD